MAKFFFLLGGKKKFEIALQRFRSIVSKHLDTILAAVSSF